MATVEANTELGQQIVEDAKRYVLYSWSVQDAINPIAVAGGEGRYFWDYDGKRYLDFASQLVNVSIGHGHPKVIAAIKEQAEKLCTIGPPMASESRSTLGRLLAEVTPGRPRDVVLHERRRRGERERDQARTLVHGPAQGDRALPLLPRGDGRRDHAHRRPAALARRAGPAGRRADARPLHLPLPGRPSRSLPGVHRRAAPRGDPPVRRARHRRRSHPRDRRRYERDHRPARRLPPVDPGGLRPARDPADLRRGHGGLRTHRQVVRLRELGRRARHPHGREGHQLRLRAARRDDRPAADRRLGARQVLRRRPHLQRPPARLRLRSRLDRGLPGGRDRRARRRDGA